MDPVSTVGLAAASIQIFDYMRNLLKDYDDYRHNRSPLTVSNFQRSAARLHNLASDVKLQSQVDRVSNSFIESHDQTIDEISTECLQLSSELLNVLDKLKGGCSSSKWYSFRQAIATSWKKEAILEFESRVAKCQNQLVLGLLGRLEAKLDEQHSVQKNHLERLEANNNKIMEVVAFTQQTVMQQSASPKREVAAVLVTLSNGETRAIAEKMQGTPLRHYDNTANNDGAVSHSEQMLRLRAPTSSEDHEASLQDPSSIHSAILKCLWFRHVSDRFEMAKNRHTETFNWIWRSSPNPEHNWTNFSEFLTSKQQIYWVNGKPGSGKTTLMKFICKAPELDTCLQTWAGNSNFIVASFFFWNLGPVSLQKSQEGLLRSILYDVLRKAHAILPAIVSELYFEFLRSQNSEFIEPTLVELITWFKRLIGHTSAQFRLCLIIDGLDEYTGSCVDLIDLLVTETSSSPFVKLVVSSRPIPVCVESFRGFPGLRLQDLTYDDIHSYVEDTLGRRIIQQGYDQSAEYVQLLSDVSEKSSGVFLWVVLVVMSLIEGLMNGENPVELRQRLDQLPPDLEDLYMQMLEKIPPHYQQQASNIFNMVLQALEYESCRNHSYPVPALQVAFAEEDQQAPLRGVTEELDPDVRRRMCIDVERRIRSRCCGLLEVNDRVIEDPIGFDFLQGKNQVMALTERKGDALYTTYPYDSAIVEQVEHHGPQRSPSMAPCIEFIHRSAVEFFRTPTGASFLDQAHKPAHLNSRRVLLRAQLRYLGCVGPSYVLDRDMKAGNHFITVASNFLEDIADAEKAGVPFDSELICTGNNIIGHHWSAASAFVFPSGCADVSVYVRRTPFVTRASRIQGHWSRVLILRKITTLGVNTPLVGELSALGFTALAFLIPYTSYLHSYIKPKFKVNQGKEHPTNILNLWVRTKVELEANDIVASKLDSSNSNLESSTNFGIHQYREWGLWNLSGGPYLRENSELVVLLLQEGADPNYSPSDNLPTTWLSFLLAVPLFQVYHEILVVPKQTESDTTHSTETRAEPQYMENILRAFILHGADLNAKIKLDVSNLETFYPNEQWLNSLPLSTGYKAKHVNYGVMEFTAGSFIELLVDHAEHTKLGLTVDFKSLLREQGYRLRSDTQRSSSIGSGRIAS
ncbi:unnamed protein product [Clonostachys rosea]|uniref:NACHT domain-containing protein n=1 Tax=Bionectria ochroleuca TaxID=29856 RepID=A0ABY6U187_BIOOC|nr:unnamed protein product [Clonostachys rosea]